MVISLFSVFVRCHVHSGSSYVCPTVFLTFFPEEVDKFYWPLHANILFSLSCFGASFLMSDVSMGLCVNWCES